MPKERTMTVAIDGNTWVYVVVQDPDKNEHIVGQHDDEADIAYIPAFPDKDTAVMGLGRLAKTKGSKYEIQAVIFDDLVAHAGEGGFFIFMLDEDGKIMEKFTPAGGKV
ncbi:MAG: hypothetical protein P8X55_11750 [Desulfosarcinaceae bacterium]|jgi:hypothetical protein